MQPTPPGRNLDDIDRRILAELVSDGRMPVNEIARRAGVSRATAYARFDRLVSDGVVTGFRAEVDPAALGYSITAMILVNVDQGEWAQSAKSWFNFLASNILP